jgi:hypothetical protein
MLLILPRQIKDSAPPAVWTVLPLQAPVTVSGYFYVVDLGPEVRPQLHHVGKDRRCTCGLGADCPAVPVVADYLRAGGKRAPDVPPGFYPAVPQACTVCGAETHYAPELSSRHRGAGWSCAKAGKAHYWLAQVSTLRAALAANPWIFPPVVAADGQWLYPGLKREAILPLSKLRR